MQHREDVPTGAVGPMMLGSLSVPAFAITFGLTSAHWGVVPSAIFSWILAVTCISFPVTIFLKWRRAKVDHERQSRRYQRLTELALDEEFDEIQFEDVDEKEIPTELELQDQNKSRADEVDIANVMFDDDSG